jgi:hypothetical protein
MNIIFIRNHLEAAYIKRPQILISQENVCSKNNFRIPISVQIWQNQQKSTGLQYILIPQAWWHTNVMKLFFFKFSRGFLNLLLKKVLHKSTKKLCIQEQ